MSAPHRSKHPSKSRPTRNEDVVPLTEASSDAALAVATDTTDDTGPERNDPSKDSSLRGCCSEYCSCAAFKTSCCNASIWTLALGCILLVVVVVWLLVMVNPLCMPATIYDHRVVVYQNCKLAITPDNPDQTTLQPLAAEFVTEKIGASVFVLLPSSSSLFTLFTSGQFMTLDSNSTDTAGCAKLTFLFTSEQTENTLRQYAP